MAQYLIDANGTKGHQARTSLTTTNLDGENARGAPKIQLAAQLVRDAPGKVLVFASEGVAVALRLLHEVLWSGAKPVISILYHGELKEEARAAAIAEFRNNTGVKALLMSYKIGGTGLNLQFATTVVLLDPNFSPANTEQAIARTVRPDVSNNLRQPVTVYHLYSRGSYEEQSIVSLDTKKRRIMGMVCNVDVQAIDLHRHLQTTLLLHNNGAQQLNLRIVPLPQLPLEDVCYNGKEAKDGGDGAIRVQAHVNGEHTLTVDRCVTFWTTYIEEGYHAAFQAASRTTSTSASSSSSSTRSVTIETTAAALFAALQKVRPGGLVQVFLQVGAELFMYREQKLLTGAFVIRACVRNDLGCSPLMQLPTLAPNLAKYLPIVHMRYANADPGGKFVLSTTRSSASSGASASSAASAAAASFSGGARRRKRSTRRRKRSTRRHSAAHSATVRGGGRCGAVR